MAPFKTIVLISIWVYKNTCHLGISDAVLTTRTEGILGKVKRRQHARLAFWPEKSDEEPHAMLGDGRLLRLTRSSFREISGGEFTKLKSGEDPPPVPSTPPCTSIVVRRVRQKPGGKLVPLQWGFALTPVRTSVHV